MISDAALVGAVVAHVIICVVAWPLNVWRYAIVISGVFATLTFVKFFA